MSDAALFAAGCAVSLVVLCGVGLLLWSARDTARPAPVRLDDLRRRPHGPGASPGTRRPGGRP